MLTITTVVLCGIYLTNGILGESCETMPKTRDVAFCCELMQDHKIAKTPKLEQMTEFAKECFETRKKEYQSLSEDEMKQRKGKFAGYNCMPECFYKKGGIVSEDGTLNKKNFIQLSAETFAETPIQEKAVAAMTKCADRMDQTNICSETNGLYLATRCFMAEMVLNCPEERFNNTEVCQASREYLKTCEDVFIQKMDP